MLTDPRGTESSKKRCRAHARWDLAFSGFVRSLLQRRCVVRHVQGILAEVRDHSPVPVPAHRTSRAPTLSTRDMHFAAGGVSVAHRCGFRCGSGEHVGQRLACAANGHVLLRHSETTRCQPLAHRRHDSVRVQTPPSCFHRRLPLLMLERQPSHLQAAGEKCPSARLICRTSARGCFSSRMRWALHTSTNRR